MPFYTRDSNYNPDPLLETKDAPLWWHDKGLSYTASGYGSKIPTRYKVKHAGRWKRVYMVIFSNAGTCYILHKGAKVTVDRD